MNWSRWLVLLTILFSAVAASNSVSAADYSITVDRNSVRVQLALNFQQNLTSLDPRFTLPVISTVLTAGNSTAAVDAVSSAVAALLPGASIRDFVMTVRSTPWSDVTGNQWFNLTASFQIVGADKNTGTFIQVDTRWKSFQVSEDILAQGASVNKIGVRYLANTAQSIVNAHPQGQPGGFVVHWGGALVPNFAVAQVFSRTSTLDLSRLATPVSQWQQSLDVKQVSTTFSFEQGTRTVLSLAATITEATGEQVQILYALVTQLNAEVKAQGLATAQGDLLLVDFGTGQQPVLMAAIIGSVITVFLASFLYERRLRGPMYRRPRRSR